MFIRKNVPIAVSAIALVLMLAAIAMNPQAVLARDSIRDAATTQGNKVGIVNVVWDGLDLAGRVNTHGGDVSSLIKAYHYSLFYPWLIVIPH